MRNTAKIYQLKISLYDIRPPIWRRILMSADASFKDLHEVIQLTFGWQDDHLHKFEMGRKKNGMNREEEIMDLTTLDDLWISGVPPTDERSIRLEDRLRVVGQTCDYTYDFGDNWEHRVILEKILERDADGVYPSCIGGKRAGPPEDCGGVGGYEQLLYILKHPKHPGHVEMLEWLGLEKADEFDPEEFDPVTANEMLKDVYGIEVLQH